MVDLSAGTVLRAKPESELAGQEFVVLPADEADRHLDRRWLTERDGWLLTRERGGAYDGQLHWLNACDVPTSLEVVPDAGSDEGITL